MTRTVFYVRYSSASQSSDTIDVQIQHCAQYAERQGYQVVDDYRDEAKSGTTEHGREAYARMLEDAERDQFDAVIVYRFDRLGRHFFESIRAIYEFENFNVKVESATESNDHLTRDIHLAVAADFSRQLSERVKDSMNSAAQKGQHLSKVPYGYRRENGEIILVDEQAEVVRQIYNLRSTGLGYQRIAKALFEEGVPSPRGKPVWSVQTIREVLNNRFYRGDTTWNIRRKKMARTGKPIYVIGPKENWIITEGTHQPAVDADLFDSVAGDGWNAASNRPADWYGKYLLTGMLTCGACGSNFVMRQQRSKGKKRYRCGRRNRYGRDACGNSLSILDQDVDEWVRSILEDLVTEDQLKAGAEHAREKQRKRNADTAVKAIRRKIADTQERIDNLVGAIELGKKLPPVIQALERADQRRVKLEADLATALRVNEQDIPSDADVARFVQSFAEALEVGSISDLRDIINATIASITVYEDGRIVALSIPPDPDIEPWEYELMLPTASARVSPS